MEKPIKPKKPKTPPGVKLTDRLVQFPAFRFPAPELYLRVPGQIQNKSLEEWRDRCYKAFELWLGKYSAFAEAFESWHKPFDPKP